MSATETGWCGTSWAPSTRNSAPTEWASSPISRSGGITPVTFDCPVTATIFVRGVTSDASTSIRPSGSSLNHFSVAPVRSASCCHGTRLAWCSISEMRISSPGFSDHASPNATRLMLSVADFVKTTSSGDAAPRKAATFARVPS